MYEFSIFFIVAIYRNTKEQQDFWVFLEKYEKFKSRKGATNGKCKGVCLSLREESQNSEIRIPSGMVCVIDNLYCQFVTNIIAWSLIPHTSKILSKSLV